MVDDPLVLGVDVGSSRIKAVLLDAAGEEVRSSSVATPFQSTGAGSEATVVAIRGALAEVLEGLGRERERVVGVGIAGLAESGAPVDATGRPLAPVIAWHDRRGEEVADRLSARFGADLARRIGQPLRYVSTVAKLGWLVDHRLEGMARWLGVPELCLHAFTGAEATEGSLAARTGCWDVWRRRWLPDVAESAGFDVGVFPEVVPAGQVMGRVSPDAAIWTGIPSGVPATVAGHDHLVGALGSGASAGDLGNSVGTAETLVGRAASPPDGERALESGVAVTVFPGGAGWAVLTSAARAGPAVEAAAETLGRSPSELDALAVGAPRIDAPGLLDSLRSRRPPALPDGPPGAVWSALLHAMAALTGEAVDDVSAVLGPRDRLVVFGGGARSAPWLAAKARCVGLPVWRSTAVDAVARGAAVMGGVAAGWWPEPTAAPRPRLEET